MNASLSHICVNTPNTSNIVHYDIVRWCRQNSFDIWWGGAQTQQIMFHKVSCKSCDITTYERETFNLSNLYYSLHRFSSPEAFDRQPFFRTTHRKFAIQFSTPPTPCRKGTKPFDITLTFRSGDPCIISQRRHIDCTSYLQLKILTRVKVRVHNRTWTCVGSN